MSVFSVVHRAQGTWTFTPGTLADAEYVTFAGKTYTFKNTVSTTNGYVYLPTGGNTAANKAAIINLVKAINLTGVAGTDYGTNMTKSTKVRAILTSDYVVTVEALTPGLYTNAIIGFVDATAGGAVDASTLGTTTAGTGDANVDLVTWIDGVIATMQPNSQLLEELYQLRSELV